MTGQTIPRTGAPRYRPGPLRDAVTALLDGLRTDGGVRVVTGEPGGGRTAFLELAVRSFRAGPVWHVKADPARSRQPFSGLHTLLRAAGRPVHVPRDGAGEALLATLRAAAAGTPLLVCVDDAHLWDPGSRAALGYAAARLRTTSGRAGLLLTVPGHRPVGGEWAGLPVLRLPPLAPADAAALLDEVTDGAVDPAVRDELVAVADGNPALVLALTHRLTPPQLRGHRPLPRPLADAETLTATTGGHLSHLDPDRTDLLLTVAAAERAAGEEGADEGAVLRAVRGLRGDGAGGTDGTGGAARGARGAGEWAVVEGTGRVTGAGARAGVGSAAGDVPRASGCAGGRAVAHEPGRMNEGLPAIGAWAAAGVGREAGSAAGRAVAADPESWPDVLVVADGRVRFRSLLLGRTVYAGASAGRRRAVHRALADALPEPHGPAALLHRSWTVTGPAPALAAELADAAAGTAWDLPPGRRRTALVRAAELTPEDALRAHRYTLAAEHALLTGNPPEALRLLDRVRGESVPASVLGRAELLRGSVLLTDGPVDDARESFLLAACLLAVPRPESAAVAGLGAADAAWAAGDMPACLRALTRDDPDHPEPAAGETGRTPAAGTRGAAAPAPVVGPHHAQGSLVADHRDGLRAVLQGRFDLAAAPLRRVVERGRPAGEPDRLLRSAAAALLLGDVTAARRAGARALAAARTLGSAALEPRALEYLAYAELRAGRHQLARTHAEEGLRAAQRAGQRNTAAHHHAVLALAASIEGRSDLVAAHVSAALSTARRHGLAQAATLAQWAAARADLGTGRPREAADRLNPLVRPGPRRGHFAVWMLAVPCFVEAAVLAGQSEHARTVVEGFALWAACGADPQAPAQLLRCRALLAAPDDADELYLRALDRHDEAAGDFERARTELLYGKWLRRRRRLREARVRLGQALLGFERCGAHLWAGQAAAELRANGVAPPAAGAGESSRNRAGELARLTPQQQRIARCVAEGATNREVALRLSVSTRTVDYHLRNIFAALGVRSRVELARLVEQAEKTGAQP
ncbi:LuxR C-terminal-related transcriptional regulator [Streptomyces sp. NPDC005931]|uniref:LuxR C-terminal-related transcriptional regulator n=1 Tax=Streptomyces sp. NPDC005931 TaxID=3364737 RepID=UPI0036B8E495